MVVQAAVKPEPLPICLNWDDLQDEFIQRAKHGFADRLVLFQGSILEDGDTNLVPETPRFAPRQPSAKTTSLPRKENTPPSMEPVKDREKKYRHEKNVLREAPDFWTGFFREVLDPPLSVLRSHYRMEDKRYPILRLVHGDEWDEEELSFELAHSKRFSDLSQKKPPKYHHPINHPAKSAWNVVDFSNELRSFDRADVVEREEGEFLKNYIKKH